jgi:hypothetical protein
MAWAYSTTTNATGTASISGSTLTFSATPTGTVAAGQLVTGIGITAGTVISFGSGLSWQVTPSQNVTSTAVTCTTKILTATGGTQGSPNSFAAGVLALQTADPAAGFQSNRYNRITSTRIDVAQGAWVKWDDLNTFEFAGSARYNPIAESSANANNGGSTIVGIEVLCMVNTSIGYNDNNCLIVNTGGTLITSRSASGINPLFVQQTSSRNDFPTFPTGIFPAVINIAGLTVRNNGASRKVYFGLARTVTAATNFNFENINGEYQTSYTTYTGYSAPVASHAGDNNAGLGNAIFYNSSWGTEQTGTIDFVVTVAARLNNYLNYNPIFPKATWSGVYTAGVSYWFQDNLYAASMYSHTPTFKSGSTKLADVVVQWLGTQTTGSTVYNIANFAEALSKNATTTSTGVVSNYLLSAMIGREAGANPGTSNKYQWSCKARAYGYISADQYVWSARSFLSDGVNAPLVEDVQLLTVPNLSLTQAGAAALTGISLVASGATGGTITLSSNRTAAEVWAYYRNWISTLANFGSNDTWDFDGTTLTIGGWTIVGLQFLTTGRVVTSTATAGGAFTSSVTGNVTQATPTSLTGVTITGSLTFNTNSPITVTLTNCTISGTVSNSGSGLVTISLSNTTIGTVDANVSTRPVTVLTLNGLTAGSQIYIMDNTGAQFAYVASSGTSYTLDTTGATGTWTWKVVRYGYIAQTGTHLPAIASTLITVALSADAFITQTTKATVAAYTTLENLDKLYDYAAYYETLNAGISYSRIITKAGTAASAGAYSVTLNNSGAIWTFTGSALSIYSTTTLAGGTTITGALFTSETETLTAAQTNTAITANVLQATPTNLSGVIISGSLTYNSASAVAVTFTNSIVSGTISNSGGGLVKVIKAGTTPWLTVGSNVSNVANVVVETPGVLALSTYIVKNGVTDLGWIAQNVARSLEIQETDTFQIYAIAYGYKAALISANALDLGTFQFELIPEPFIDTSLSTVTRDLIASKFSTALDAFGRIALSLDTDLRSYTPAEVMNAIEWYIVTEGDLIAAGVVYAGTIDGVTIINGGILISTPGFYGQVNNSVTTTSALGILVPIYIDVDPGVYVIDPTYLPVQKNTSGIVLQTAPWTKQTADISSTDKAGIAAETVAAMNAAPPDVNISKINGLLVTGTGTEATPWGPA